MSSGGVKKHSIGKVMNTIKITQQQKEMLARDALKLTPAEMVFMSPEEIKEWNEILYGKKTTTE